ncbi:hypothetical protein [Chitinophaga arvensicola]|uniref:hypothetical protein n=1 Tax=Chitinophaga arvensicola TaxID=29529 RepID=UPI000B7E672A|nr:hypothetical protein [Chitinophaga arvensicola]
MSKWLPYGSRKVTAKIRNIGVLTECPFKTNATAVSSRGIRFCRGKRLFRTDGAKKYSGAILFGLLIRVAANSCPRK